MQETSPLESKIIDKPLILAGENIDLFAEYNAGRLPILTINLTGRCNLDCIYCFTNAGEADPDELNMDEWRTVLDEASDLGCRVVHIGGKGEPTIDKCFEEFVEYASSKGMQIILDTNATFIDAEMASFLYQHDVTAVVKIPSFDEKVYDELANVKGLAPAAYDGLNQLIEAGYPYLNDNGKEIETNLAVMSLVCAPAKDTIRDVWLFNQAHNIYSITTDMVVGGRAIKNYDKLKISREEKMDLYQQFLEDMDQEPSSRAEKCHIVHGIYVNNNGEVMADSAARSCDTSHEEFGMNVRDFSIEEIFNSLKEVRNSVGSHDHRIHTNEPFKPCFRAVDSQKEMQ
jgi:organic radical activating enzyme